MFESRKERKKTAKERIGKSGGELKLSAKGDEDARKYLADMDTPLPERFKYKESEKDDETNNPEKMKTVKSAFSTDKDELLKAGEFEFNTGWMEIGYDKKKKELITSFKGGYRTSGEREVFENRPYSLGIGETRAKSNDKSFKEGAISLRTSEDKDDKKIIDRWERFSNIKGNNTTFDSVEPFHQTNEQKDKLEQLKNLRRQNGFSDSGLDKAITGVTTYKNKKDSMKLNYEREFKEVIEKVKTKVNSNIQDDVLLYLLKKKQIEEQQALLGEDVVKQEMLQKLLVELLKLRLKQLMKNLNKGK